MHSYAVDHCTRDRGRWTGLARVPDTDRRPEHLCALPVARRRAELRQDRRWQGPGGRYPAAATLHRRGLPRSATGSGPSARGECAQGAFRPAAERFRRAQGNLGGICSDTGRVAGRLDEGRSGRGLEVLVGAGAKLSPGHRARPIACSARIVREIDDALRCASRRHRPRRHTSERFCGCCRSRVQCAEVDAGRDCLRFGGADAAPAGRCDHLAQATGCAAHSRACRLSHVAGPRRLRHASAVPGARRRDRSHEQGCGEAQGCGDGSRTPRARFREGARTGRGRAHRA